MAQTFNLTVTAVNAAPVLTGDLAATVSEGGSYMITGADLGYSDPDDVDSGITFTVSSLVNGHGSGRRRRGDFVHWHAAQPPARSASCTMARRRSAASFQVAVEDGNEDGSAPVAQTFNLTVTAVNAAPVLTGDLAATVSEGGSYVDYRRRSRLQRS